MADHKPHTTTLATGSILEFASGANFISNWTFHVDEEGRISYGPPESPLLIQAREDLAAGVPYELVLRALKDRFDYYNDFGMADERGEVVKAINTLHKEHEKE